LGWKGKEARAERTWNCTARKFLDIIPESAGILGGGGGLGIDLFGESGKGSRDVCDKVRNAAQETAAPPSSKLKLTIGNTLAWGN